MQRGNAMAAGCLATMTAAELVESTFFQGGHFSEQSHVFPCAAESD